MGVNYTQQKLWEAVNLLIGAQPIRERLRYAARYLHQARSDSHIEPAFPVSRGDLQDRFIQVIERLSDSSQIAALSDADAETLAREIVALLCEANSLATFPVGSDPRR